MSELLHSLSAVALIILMAAVGYVFGRAGWMRAEHKQFIVKLIINVAVPCMCISNLLDGSVSQTLVVELWPLLLASLLCMGVGLGVGVGLAKLLHIGRERYGVFVVMCGLSNSMFVGYPMCIALFGDTAAPYVLMFYIVNTFLFWTAGVALIGHSGLSGKPSPLQSLKRLATAPLITLVIVIALLYAGVKPPDIVLRFCGYMGNLVTPLALVFIGFVMYENGLRSLRISKDMAVMLAARFIAMPALMIGICHALGITGIARGVLMIESAMPTMTQAVVISTALGADERYAAEGMSISTLACIVAMPLLMLLA